MAKEPLQRKKFLKPNYDPIAKLSRLRRIPSTRNLAEGVKNFIRTNPLLVLRASRRIETSKGPKYAILLSTLLALMGRPAFSQETSPVVVFTNPESSKNAQIQYKKLLNKSLRRKQKDNNSVNLT